MQLGVDPAVGGTGSMPAAPSPHPAIRDRLCRPSSSNRRRGRPNFRCCVYGELGVLLDSESSGSSAQIALSFFSWPCSRFSPPGVDAEMLSALCWLGALSAISVSAPRPCCLRPRRSRSGKATLPTCPRP